jgi:phosphoribosylformylglycinamidine cyclo-ligase
MTRRRAGLTYEEAGVDVAAAERFVNAIGPLVRSTHGAAVVASPSTFAGLIRPDVSGLTDPLLAATCDGVGTKVLLARGPADFEGLGRDLVAMSVNDLVAVGARPLLFLDYLASGRLDPPRLEAVVRGVAAACRDAGCALLGGETAEMPDVYGEGVVELAGFAIGLVDGAHLPDPAAMRPGDAVVGLPSTGLHANGYTLARRALFDRGGLSLDDTVPGSGGATVGDALLTPTALYVEPVLDLMAAVEVRAAAHVTGGGLVGRARGMLPPGTGMVIDGSAFRRPAVIDLICTVGEVPFDAAASTFNMGLGFLAVVEAGRAPDAEAMGWLGVGEIVTGDGKVILRGG